ncbi:hypothetical protein SAMN02745687_01942 [Lachnospiraceae bacterium NK3A20]|nr:hypothetical protein SAMN02745687_01942 [Lachnospiraceae bacterium NK3A20]
MALADETRQQRQKLKGKSLKEKLSYFWDYYKIHTIVVIAIAAAAISIVHSIVTNKPSVFAFTALNASIPDDAYDTMYGEITDALGIDTKEQGVTLDLQEYLTPGGDSSQYDIATRQKIFAETAAASLDVMVADQHNFDAYAKNGTFGDLRDYLSDEQMGKYQADLYYVDMKEIEKFQKEMDSPDFMTKPKEDPEDIVKEEMLDGFTMPDPDTMEEPVPLGIVINKTPFNEKYSAYPSVVGIAGIMTNTVNEEYSTEFIDYLYAAK